MKWTLLTFLPAFQFVLSAATPYHAVLHYTDLPDGARPQKLVAGAPGSLFIISQIKQATGLLQIHVQKTDAAGNTLASFDFGGSNTSGFGDSVSGAVLDQKGNLIIVGSTSAPDFPLVAPLTQSAHGNAAFITKIDSQLKNILFSTRLGGTQGGTSGGGVAVDSAGNLYVTGLTSDTDFPVTSGAFQKTPPQKNQSFKAQYAFVTKISADSKAILFSTYFGNDSVVCVDGSSLCGSSTFGVNLALDQSGNVVISGNTSANQLPVTPAAFGQTCGACSPVSSAGFVAKFSSDLSKLLWATYIPVVSASPNNFTLRVQTMAVDGSGNVILGGTSSRGLSVTDGALQTAFPGLTTTTAFGGFVMKLDSVGQHQLFSTYFGEEDPFFAFGLDGIVLDAQGAIWLTGISVANRLPVPKGSPILGEAYLAELSSDGSTLANIFTAPNNVVGLAVVAGGDGTVTATGTAGALLTATPGQGPSIVGIGNSAGNSISDTVAPYEFVSFYGLGLGPQSSLGAQLANGIVTNSLGGVQVLFDGIPAPLLFAGPTQINALVPSTVYGQDTTKLQIITPSGTLTGLTMRVHLSQPGVFSNDTGAAAPFAAALNQDGSVNSPTNPAALGSIVTVWASGAGVSTAVPTDGAILSSAFGRPTLPVAMYSFPLLIALRLGQLPAGPLSLEVLYAGDAAALVAGVTQINFRLPGHVDTSLNNVGFALQVGDLVSDAFSIYLKPQ
jgi:uncharacterized protein (TIGR03437 family)